MSMTLAQKDSAVKKLNERYTEIARKFGKNSGVAKEFQNALALVFGEDSLHSAKGRKTSGTKRRQSAADMGLKLVSRDKSVLNNVSSEDIDALLSHHTAGEIRRAAKPEAKTETMERRKEDPHAPAVTERDVLEAMDYVYDLMQDDDETLYEAYQLYWGAVGKGGSKPTYTVLADIVRDLKAADRAYKDEDKERGQAIDNRIKERLSRLNKFDSEEAYFT